MVPPDDIPLDPPAGETTSETGGGVRPKDESPRRKVGPESEVRGGPEAIDKTLDDSDPQGGRPHRIRR
jgi:hypothetical protein